MYFAWGCRRVFRQRPLNKWDNPLSSVHMLMPILMKYTVKENKGGWYHRRQRKTSGFSACMMQDRHIVPLKNCCTVSPLLEMLAQRQALLRSPIRYKFALLTWWSNENTSLSKLRASLPFVFTLCRKDKQRSSQTTAQVWATHVTSRCYPQTLEECLRLGVLSAIQQFKVGIFSLLFSTPTACGVFLNLGSWIWRARDDVVFELTSLQLQVSDCLWSCLRCRRS